MFEHLKITIKDFRDKYPMPRFVQHADKSQEFYEKILEDCTHDGVILKR